MKKIKLQVTKPSIKEVRELQEFLCLLSEALKTKTHVTLLSQFEKKITKIAETLPDNAWLVAFVCGILLENFQDKESKIISMPQWITEMYTAISNMEHYLSSNKLNTIEPDSHFHIIMKEIIQKQK